MKGGKMSKAVFTKVDYSLNGLLHSIELGDIDYQIFNVRLYGKC